MGYFGSPEYLKYSELPNVKIEVLTSNLQQAVDENLFYIVANINSEKKIIYIRMYENNDC